MHRSAVDLAYVDDDWLYFGTLRRDEDVSGYLGVFLLLIYRLVASCLGTFGTSKTACNPNLGIPPSASSCGEMRRPRAHRQPVSPSRARTEALNPTDSPWCLGESQNPDTANCPLRDVAAATTGTRHDWPDGGTSGDRRRAGRLAAASQLAGDPGTRGKPRH